MDGVLLICRWWIVNFRLFLRISGCIYYLSSLLSVKLLDTKFYISDVVLILVLDLEALVLT